MTINWWCNWSINLFIKISLFGKFYEFFFCELILFAWCYWTCADNAVGLNFSSKQRETLFNIQWHVISVFVDTCNFYFLPWLNRVNIITQQDNFFTSGDSTWQNFWRWFLDSDFLIVSINSFLFNLFKWSSRLTRNTLTMFNIFRIISINRILNMPTLLTSEINNFQLVEYFTSDSDNSSNYLYKKNLPLINLPKWTNLNSLM